MSSIAVSYFSIADFEPLCQSKFDDSYETSLYSVSHVKGLLKHICLLFFMPYIYNWLTINLLTGFSLFLVESLYKFITNRHHNSVPLCINVASPSFKSFQR